MRLPQGYVTIVDPTGTQEQDTFTCSHCQKIVAVRALTDAADQGGLCKVCDKFICSRCVWLSRSADQTCITWEKQMEKMEARERFRRSLEL
jgi:hypothetical protein